MTGTNGILEYRRNEVSVFAPRDTFDEKGFFVNPPVVRTLPMPERELYSKSLEASVRYFLESCRDREAFPDPLYEQSLETNRLMLSLGGADTSEPKPTSGQAKR